MKTCPGCKLSKPLLEFYKNKISIDGLSYKCKTCLYQPTKPRKLEQWSRDGAKPCSNCKQTKALGQFQKLAYGPLGLSYWCSECLAERSKRLRSEAMTDEQRNKLREQEWRKSKLEQGLCTRCGDKPIDIARSRISCTDCLLKISERGRVKAGIWISRGLCRQCGDERDSESTRCAGCREKEKVKQLDKNRKRRIKLLDLYGGKCACCGENNPYFLSIDHINRDGNIERKKKGGKFSYSTIIRRDDLRLLCFNCNCGRELTGDGRCPHEL